MFGSKARQAKQTQQFKRGKSVNARVAAHTAKDSADRNAAAKIKRQNPSEFRKAKAAAQKAAVQKAAAQKAAAQKAK